MARVREDMKRWGITVSFLAAQLGVSRQYAWQAVHYRSPISLERAREIAGTVDRIITGRSHMRSFGEQLRAARIASGLTLKQVAGLIGYSWVGVERWEKDICRPKPGVLWHLFTVYGDSSRSIHQGMPPLAASAE
jgi:transcriptional regulator with XRE-family HTH domain